MVKFLLPTGDPSLPIWVNPKFRIAKCGLNKPETPFNGVVIAYFDILNCFDETHECDRWTDILIANAALNYVE